MRRSAGPKGIKSASSQRIRACVAEALESRVLLAADLKFAVIGDFSSDVSSQNELDVSNLVKSWSPAFVVTVGDNNYPSGGASTIDANVGQFYHQFISPYTGTYGAGSADGQNHFFPALGNHDWMAAGAQPYLNYFTLPGNERYYDVQQGNVGIFVVDADPNEPDGNTSGSIQGKWLQSELAKSTAQYKLVFFHQAAYSSGGIGDNTWMQWPFQQWGATAVFQGHDHDYERLIENGLPYFVDGLGGESIVGFGATQPGSQVRYAGDYGAMLVDASSTAITFQFITRTGQVIDTYTVGTVTSPAAPSNLTATVASYNQINLAWKSNSTNQTGFKIERSTDGINFTLVTTTAATATSYSDTTLAANTTYYYRVRATNGGGDSTASNVASATTQTSVSLIAAGSVWKYLDNGSNQGTAWRVTSFNDTTWKSGPSPLGYGASDATNVSYGAKASNKYITTYFRQSITIANPASISALTLQLMRDDGAVVYLNGTEVFRSNMPTGTISNTTKASSNADGTTQSTWFPAAINPALLLAGINVIAVEVHQYSASSSVLNFNFSLTGSGAITSPAPPTNLTAVATSASQVALGWTDTASNESGFKIERSTDDITFTQIAATAANITSFNDTTATGVLTYYYRVRATNTAGDSAYSNIAAALPLTPPLAPTNLVATGTASTAVNLTWTTNSNNEAGFEVDRSTDGVNWILLIVAEDGSTAYTDSAVSAGATYEYRVRAVNPAGNSAWTNTATVTVPAATQIVYLSDLNWVSATNGWGPVEKDMSVGGPNAGDGRTLMLNGITYSKGLGVNSVSQIVYNLGGAYSTFQTDVGVDDEETVNGTVDFQVLADGALLFDSGTMTATSPTLSYSVSVAGVQQLTLICGDAGDGPDYDHGDWAGARLTLAPTPVTPVAPSNLSATAVSTSQVNLIWTDNSANETGFKIERSTDGISYAVIGTVATNITTYSDTTGQASTLYDYRIRATNSAGDSAPTNVASATTLAAAATVTYLSDLTWVSATNAWGPVEKDMSNGGQNAGDGHTITLNGVTYAKGLGVNAISQIVYNLGGQYSTFLSDVGIDDEETTYGTVDFQVLADGVKIYDSGVMTAISATKSINISVAGVQQLTLICSDAGDGPDYDHGDWAGARLTSPAPVGAALVAGSQTTPFNTTTPITSSTTTSAASQLTTDQTGRTTSGVGTSSLTVTSASA